MYLERLLQAANPADGLVDNDDAPDGPDWDESDWDDVSAHLKQASPWFGKVLAGESPGDPDDIPQGWADRGDELQRGELSNVLLTPRTAEASTVHQPTVGPGGPGLFHMKGRQLPPYVQHLYKHLVGKYGKHRAYGVAIGIVKKWAAGVNPGGKGKGHKVHADVQAAAGKNIAEWEKDKADAHAHGGDHKVKASNVALAGGVVPSYVRRGRRGELERVGGYNRNYLAAIAQVKPFRPFSKNIVFDFDGTMTDDRNGHHSPVHIDTRGIRMAHDRGYSVAVVSAWPRQGIVNKLREHGFNAFLDDAPRREFWDGGPDGRQIIVTGNKVSAAGYIDDKAINHQPGDDWEHTLNQVDRLKVGFIPEPHPDPDRPRFGRNRMGVVPLEGELGLSRPQGGVKIYLSSPAAWPSGKPYKQSFLPPGPTTGGGLKQGDPLRTGVITNAPGTKPAGYGQLYQSPSQTVGVGPSLPPGATLPTAADLEKLAGDVPDAPDASLSESTRVHLRAAAEKVRKNDPTEALRCLRSAQTGLHAAYRSSYMANTPNLAEVYGHITSVPPAAQSSATNAMLAGRELTTKFRSLHHTVSQHIDAFRRSHFHGMYANMPEARFSVGEALDRVLALSDVGEYDREYHGRIVHVRDYQRHEHQAPYNGELRGDEADEAIRRGKGRGDYGESTGFFQTNAGPRMWGWYGAAGLLVRHTDSQGVKRYLLQKRSPHVQDGNTYSTPGGAIEHVNGVPETPEQAARREAVEEFGSGLPEGTKTAEVRTKTLGTGKGAWSYHTVVMDAPHMFNPEGGNAETAWESSGYKWVTPHEMADLPLHKHFRDMAESLGMPAGGGQHPPRAGLTYLTRVELAFGRVKAHDRVEHGRVEHVQEYERRADPDHVAEMERQLQIRDATGALVREPMGTVHGLEESRRMTLSEAKQRMAAAVDHYSHMPPDQLHKLLLGELGDDWTGEQKTEIMSHAFNSFRNFQSEGPRTSIVDRPVTTGPRQMSMFTHLTRVEAAYERSI